MWERANLVRRRSLFWKKCSIFQIVFNVGQHQIFTIFIAGSKLIGKFRRVLCKWGMSVTQELSFEKFSKELNVVM